MQKKKLISFLIICMLAGTVTGCQSDENTEEAVTEEAEETIFGLTQSEQKLYAEYAAGILMKYNAGTNMRVLEGQKLIRAEEEEAATLEKEEKKEDQTADMQENQENSTNEKQDLENQTAASSSEKQYVSDMAAVTEMEAFSISYTGYELTASYPDSTEEVFMAMDASLGKKLLVEKFKVTNLSGESKDFDMFSKQGKFKTTVNGKSYKSQYTLLLNDLSMYKGEIAAGETMEMVLIFEIPEAVESIESMELSITAGDKKGTMLLSTGSADASIRGEEVQEPEVSDEETLMENSELAEEYMKALEAEENGLLEQEETQESQGEENVTVVGSRKQ